MCGSVLEYAIVVATARGTHAGGFFNSYADSRSNFKDRIRWKATQSRQFMLQLALSLYLPSCRGEDKDEDLEV